MIPYFDNYCKSIEDLRQGCEVVFVQGLLNAGPSQVSNAAPYQKDSMADKRVKIINSK